MPASNLVQSTTDIYQRAGYSLKTWFKERMSRRLSDNRCFIGHHASDPLQDASKALSEQPQKLDH